MLKWPLHQAASWAAPTLCLRIWLTYFLHPSRRHLFQAWHPFSIQILQLSPLKYHPSPLRWKPSGTCSRQLRPSSRLTLAWPMSTCNYSPCRRLIPSRMPSRPIIWTRDSMVEEAPWQSIRPRTQEVGTFSQRILPQEAEWAWTQSSRHHNPWCINNQTPTCSQPIPTISSMRETIRTWT